MKHLFISAAVMMLFIAGCSKDISRPADPLPTRETIGGDTIVPGPPPPRPDEEPPGGPPDEPLDSLVFKNLTWIFPWYNSLEIRNFTDLLFGRTHFNIYVRRENNPDWIKVVPYDDDDYENKYMYYIETYPENIGLYRPGALYIFYYGFDVNDRPSVKIVFYI